MSLPPRARLLLPGIGAALLVSMAGAIAPSRASALCSSPAPVADAIGAAQVVFVGTVTAVADDDRTATFHVQEIWKGPNLSDPSTVYGGSAGVEDARTWEPGQRYLVLPTVDKDGNLFDNACSATSVYRAELDALRPAGAHPPQGPPTSGPPGDPPIAAVFLLIVLVGTAGALLLLRNGRLGASGTT